jgi:hypothetical protein
MPFTAKPAPSSAEPVVCKQSFIGRLKGTEVKFAQGEVVAADHPAVKEWPSLFEAEKRTIREYPSTKVEQATAAPGEKRA